jgi:hypothetical protein
MYSNTLQEANAGLAGAPHLSRSTEPKDMPPLASVAPDIMSGSEASKFSDAIMHLEAAVKENASKTADPPVDITTQDEGIDPGKIVQRQSEQDLLQDCQKNLQPDLQKNAPQDVSGSMQTVAAAAMTGRIDPGFVITISAPAPSIAKAGDAGMSISTLPQIGPAADIRPSPTTSHMSSVHSTSMRGASDSTISSLARNPSLSIAGPPQINNGAPQTQLSADAQTLLSEFENSINHFERSGNSWVGSAGITFQASVLKGAFVRITSDGKSLNILLTRLASMPIAHALQRQEQQLSDALTRKLGRNVSVRVSGNVNDASDSETQATDDVESR